MRIGIVIFDDVDLMDVGGPYEVFLTASRLVARDGGAPPFEVVTLSRTAEPVVAYGGLRLLAQMTLAEAGALDVLVVPGAIAIDDVLGDGDLLAALRSLDGVGLMTSVCTGAFILGELGLLDDRPWTTHWEDVTAHQERVGGGGVAGVRWVDAGEIVTAGGLTSGIAMALHLVDRLSSRELAVRTARQLDYDWDPEPAR